MSELDVEIRMAYLAQHHWGVDNDPFEPYQGVQLLFNGDWRMGCREDSDRIRSHWRILSPYVMVYTGPSSKEIEDAEEAEVGQQGA